MSRCSRCGRKDRGERFMLDVALRNSRGHYCCEDCAMGWACVCPVDETEFDDASPFDLLLPKTPWWETSRGVGGFQGWHDEEDGLFPPYATS